MNPLASTLLDAILDAPDDPVPRLVLADWCDEFGDDVDRVRASMIRGQYAPTLPFSPVVFRDLHFVTCYGNHHMDAEHESAIDLTIKVRCGFVEEIHATQERFINQCWPLFLYHPIRRVVVSDRIPGPYVLPHTFNWWHWRCRGSWPEQPSDLAPCLWKELRHPRIIDSLEIMYKDTDEAVADLEQACLSWGQSIRRGNVS
jgi:uncharacterized protein (TIGR02996 family)